MVERDLTMKKIYLSFGRHAIDGVATVIDLSTQEETTILEMIPC